jgi:hypothetical protein
LLDAIDAMTLLLPNLQMSSNNKRLMDTPYESPLAAVTRHILGKGALLMHGPRLRAGLNADGSGVLPTAPAARGSTAHAARGSTAHAASSAAHAAGAAASLARRITPVPVAPSRHDTPVVASSRDNIDDIIDELVKKYRLELEPLLEFK